MNNQDYTVTEVVKLPSKGKVYDKPVEPEITLRAMTLNDEMKRLSPSEKTYQNLCQMIDDCIISNPGISSYNMCLGDYQYLLYKLRTITYGPEYTGQAICPYCGSTNKSSFSLDDLPVYSYTKDIEKYREFDLPVSGERVKIRMRTPKILDNAQMKLKEFKQRNTSADATVLYMIESVIEEIDGMTPDPIFIQEWIKKLNMKDANTITNYSDKLDNSISVETGLQYTCDICRLPFNSRLKTDIEFFRPTLGL